jgi:NTE family protein
LRASVSLPGILPPVISREQVLVDGGVIDNLPIEIMHARGAGPVLGVDIETAGAISAGADVGEAWSAWEFLRRLLWRRKQTLPLPSIVKILLRSALISSGSAAARHRAAADLIFRPPTAQIDLLDWQSFDRVVDIGYRHARQVLDGLKDQPLAQRIFIA